MSMSSGYIGEIVVTFDTAYQAPTKFRENENRMPNHVDGIEEDFKVVTLCN